MPESAADVVALSFLRYLAEQDTERQARYRAYREYYDGEHATQLTRRQRRYLQLKFGTEFRDNYCPIVVDCLSERLSVTGFETDTKTGPDQDALGALLWDWWQANRMDATQNNVHLAAVRDGDAYLIVEWDEEQGIPTFTMELAYDGTDGVKFHYSDDRRGEPLFASKRWVIDDPANGAGYKRRLNLYYPDRIEKYVSDAREFEGAWQRYEEEAEPWPVPWTRTGSEGGEPLGIPVVHFRFKAGGYNFGRSRLDDVLPLQNQLNKALIDVVGVADANGFPILWATGDDWGDLNVGPGAVLTSTKPDARLGAIPTAEMGGLLAYKNDIIMDIGRVSNTPLSRLQFTGQIAAEGTLKQQEVGLVAEAETTQVAFGNAWEDVLALGIRLHNTFGPGGANEDAHIDTQWKPAATRDDTELAQRMQLWSSLGVPDEIVWKHLGLTDDEIEQARTSEQYKAKLASQRAMLELDRGEDEEG